jgi:hypothetical protein
MSQTQSDGSAGWRGNPLVRPNCRQAYKTLASRTVPLALQTSAQDEYAADQPYRTGTRCR